MARPFTNTTAYRSFFKILIFGIVLAFFALAYCLIEVALIGPLETYPSTGNPYNFVSSSIITISGAFILGISFGFFEVFLLNKIFNKSSFLSRLLYKMIFYFVAINIFFVVGTMGASSMALRVSFVDPLVFDALYQFFTNLAYPAISLYAVGATFVVLFVTETINYLGPQVTWDFLTGRYHHPQMDKRIFMFLDMKSSTSTAEKLGHSKYFTLLKEYYGTMTDAIIKSGGEIYQYVGDEIIITWKFNDGIANNNFLNCFFKIKEAFNSRETYFRSTFDFLPEFKAGIHYGEVTSGEIGQLKKEVLFTGDALNTTSRIQNLCNEYQVDLLVSSELLSYINLPESVQSKEIGECILKGKDQKVNLSTVSRVVDQ